MVNDVIEKLLDLDMEPKPESLWWTITYQAEEKATLKVWDLLFEDVFDVLGYCFHRDGNASQGADRT